MSAFDRLADLVSRVAEVPLETITPNSNLEQLDIDSLALVELSLRVNSDFGITVEDGDIQASDTVGSIAQFIDSKLPADLTQGASLPQ
ncbi:acyl carrier protein [Streptomyces roseochromogenus]|uniref:Carrier domain-containing protein n=1 Tax=Streptomyces roseochromogenus subsp. oscitans DS 12.976 TaxID=1352936 RepID=V6JJF3_STRRC|nr:acyl carrier protein [Streptomyces roseochromogenus]EST20037.1 hypothetical protein M878_40210 [Streptomyces roseochromogenus subsp. oscitans DS 12.976]